MDKLKQGANYAQSKTKQLAAVAGEGIKKTGEGIKKTGVGISDNYEYVTEKFHHHKFNADEELIHQYKHDLKHVIKAINHIKKQIKSLAYNHWRILFKINLKIVNDFLLIIGPNSLKFKGIEKYYHDWDEYQATQPIPLVHPLDKQFLIDSINIQLTNYLYTIENLQSQIINDWQAQYDRSSLQIDEATSYIKQALKLIGLWYKKKFASDKLMRKIDKLNANATLDEQQQLKLTDLETKLTDANMEFDKVSAKTKEVLPHLLSFLDEFVDDITKLLYCKQLQTYDTIKSTLFNFSTFFGYLNTEDNVKGTSGETGTTKENAKENETSYKDQRLDDQYIQSYQQIMDEWEILSTPARLQIESFVSLIYNKKPELLDSEINDLDQSTKASKLIGKISKKVTDRKYTFKATDPQNGVFVDYLESDPLQSFVKYFDETMYRSETYHPRKLINVNDLVVIPPNLDKPVPPLPPRSNIIENKPVIPLPQELKSPVLPAKAAFKSYQPPPYSIERNYTDESIDMFASDDDDASSVTSVTVSEVSSMLSKDILDHCGSDQIHSELQKLYNSHKNEIKAAPIYDSSSKYHIHPDANVTFKEPSTMTRKLDEFNNIFGKIISASEKLNISPKLVAAKYDFKGEEPGDLSFKANDEIEILLNLQTVNTLYNKEENNWLIGLIRSGANYRVGFVPNNYLTL